MILVGCTLHNFSPVLAVPDKFFEIGEVSGSEIQSEGYRSRLLAARDVQIFLSAQNLRCSCSVRCATSSFVNDDQK
jgi:hypothetical protein